METNQILEQQIEQLRKELSSLSNNQAIYDNEINKALEQIKKIFNLKEAPTLDEVTDLIEKLDNQIKELSKRAKKLSDDAKAAMEKYNKEKNNA